MANNFNFNNIQTLYELARGALDNLSLNGQGEGSGLAGRFTGGLFEAGAGEESNVEKVAEEVVDEVVEKAEKV